MLTAYAQGPGLALEQQALARHLVDLQQHMGTGQGRVTTQGDFSGGGKPANLPLRAIRHHKGSFGKVVFSGDLLHQLIAEPMVKAVDHGRIAGKGTLTEGVDLMKFQLHATTLSVLGH
ncbi:hypothetical protein D3C76_1090130 [compost metagenome]